MTTITTTPSTVQPQRAGTADTDPGAPDDARPGARTEAGATWEPGHIAMPGANPHRTIPRPGGHNAGFVDRTPKAPAAQVLDSRVTFETRRFHGQDIKVELDVQLPDGTRHTLTDRLDDADGDWSKVAHFSVTDEAGTAYRFEQPVAYAPTVRSETPSFDGTYTDTQDRHSVRAGRPRAITPDVVGPAKPTVQTSRVGFRERSGVDVRASISVLMPDGSARELHDDLAADDKEWNKTAHFSTTWNGAAYTWEAPITMGTKHAPFTDTSKLEIGAVRRTGPAPTPAPPQGRLG